MTTEYGNGIPACIYGKNKMPDGFGRFIVGIKGNKGRRAEDGFGEKEQMF